MCCIPIVSHAGSASPAYSQLTRSPLRQRLESTPQHARAVAGIETHSNTCRIGKGYSLSFSARYLARYEITLRNPPSSPWCLVVYYVPFLVTYCTFTVAPPQNAFVLARTRREPGTTYNPFPSLSACSYLGRRHAKESLEAIYIYTSHLGILKEV